MNRKEMEGTQEVDIKIKMLIITITINNLKHLHLIEVMIQACNLDSTNKLFLKLEVWDK